MMLALKLRLEAKRYGDRRGRDALSLEGFPTRKNRYDAYPEIEFIVNHALYKILVFSLFSTKIKAKNKNIFNFT